MEGDNTCGVWYSLRDVGKAAWDCSKLVVGCREEELEVGKGGSRLVWDYQGHHGAWGSTETLRCLSVHRE